MGVFSTNLTEITSGGLISSSHTSDVYNVLSGNIAENVVISGSFTVSAGPIVFLSGSATQFVVTESIHTTLTSTSASISYVSVSDKFISEGSILFYTASLPTTDPLVNGQLWRSGSYLMISTGSI
jgi:hypothetical protein